jgi:hypothetical protein
MAASSLGPGYAPYDKQPATGTGGGRSFVSRTWRASPRLAGFAGQPHPRHCRRRSVSGSPTSRIASSAIECSTPPQGRPTARPAAPNPTNTATRSYRQGTGIRQPPRSRSSRPLFPGAAFTGGAFTTCGGPAWFGRDGGCFGRTRSDIHKSRLGGPNGDAIDPSRLDVKIRSLSSSESVGS